MTLIMFFVFLIGIADVYVAGKIGKEMQAAYGLVSQIYFIFSIVAFALTVGTVSVVSRLFTSERRKEFLVAVDSSVAAACVCGAVIGVLSLLLSAALISALGVPTELKPLATVLMRIYSFGIFFNYLFIATNGVLRASGLIKKSLWTMVVVCVMNIILNFTLVFNTPLGFKGIAVATVLSTVTGCILNFVFLRHIMNQGLIFSAVMIKKILAIGWPAGVLQVLWQLAALVLFLILSTLPVNNIEVLAAFTNGLRIEAAIFLPAFAFNMPS